MRFSDSFLQELADRNSIEDVVGAYVDLSKKSGSNLFGLCPFHNEKTPSFSVSTSGQFYHCFGCGKGGGAINFIMEMENLTFPEAVEFLAKKSGMQMPEHEETPDQRRRDRMLSLNRDAAKYYHSLLKQPAGRPAIEYIKTRRISPKFVTAFGLGYAPDSWDFLTKEMKKLGYLEAELLDAGLSRKNQSGRLYDFFRNRLMFPVIDVKGNVLGFSGRIIGEGEPKYLNTGETLVFQKNKNLFGLNLSKKTKRPYMILCEGNIDVVSLHQAGFDCALASLGTSLTNEQARIISRYTKEVIIAYDSDGAGKKATKRAIEIFGNLDVSVKILKMTGAKDPDEFIKVKGADAFASLIESSDDSVTYSLENIASTHTISSPEDKVAYLKDSAAYIAELSSPIEREVFAGRIAEKAGVPLEVFKEEIERARKNKLKDARAKTEKNNLRIGKLAQPREKSIRYENDRSALAEEGLIRLAYKDCSMFTKEEAESIKFSCPELKKIFSAIIEKTVGQRSPGPNELSGVLSQEEMNLFTELISRPENLSAKNDYLRIINEENSIDSAQDDLLAFAELMRKNKAYGGTK